MKKKKKIFIRITRNINRTYMFRARWAREFDPQGRKSSDSRALSREQKISLSST